MFPFESYLIRCPGWVNLDILEQAGWDPSALPATWDDVRELCLAVQDLGEVVPAGVVRRLPIGPPPRSLMLAPSPASGRGYKLRWRFELHRAAPARRPRTPRPRRGCGTSRPSRQWQDATAPASRGPGRPRTHAGPSRRAAARRRRRDPEHSRDRGRDPPQHSRD